jgi:hypothetical protein
MRKNSSSDILTFFTMLAISLLAYPASRRQPGAALEAAPPPRLPSRIARNTR